MYKHPTEVKVVPKSYFAAKNLVYTSHVWFLGWIVHSGPEAQLTFPAPSAQPNPPACVRGTQARHYIAQHQTSLCFSPRVNYSARAVTVGLTSVFLRSPTMCITLLSLHALAFAGYHRTFIAALRTTEG